MVPLKTVYISSMMAAEQALSGMTRLRVYITKNNMYAPLQ